VSTFIHAGRELSYAGFWRRALAALLDNLVWIIGIASFFPGELIEDNETAAGIVAIALFTLWFNYFALCEWRFGQTIGKNATGLRVLSLDGGRLGWNQAAIRNILRLVDFPLALLGVGALIMQRSARRQRLGDRLAKTIVVREPDPVEAQASSAHPPPAGPTTHELFPEATSELGFEKDPTSDQEVATSDQLQATPPEPAIPSGGFPFATWSLGRTVWGLVAALLLGGVLVPLLLLPFDPDLGTDDGSIGGLLVAQGLLEATLIGVALWVASTGPPQVPTSEGLARLGLRRFGARSAKWIGLAMLAYYAFTITYSLLIVEPKQEDVARDLGLDTGPLAAIAVIALIAIAAPISEEIFFRGMLFGGLRRRLSRVPAAALSGVLFGLVHAPTGLTAVPPLAAFGFILALLYERTRSLGPGIVAHGINNSLALALTL
jgi:membrane protease YdiL (CAAX protease family)/uncharacterized RDD family membrane protein YckC